MKRIFILSIILCAAIQVWAQDVITLNSGDEIEALVQKIGETEVAYKKWDFQDGPTFTIRKSEIFRIRYQNGTKEVFNNLPEPKEPQPEQTNYTPVTPPPPVTPLTPLQKEFYSIGNNDSEMLLFFERNGFTDYGNRFAAACKKKNNATGWLVTGSIFTATGVALLIGRENAVAKAHPYELRVNTNYRTLQAWGFVVVGVGQLFTIISIPNYVKAAKSKKAIKNDFSRHGFGTEYGYLPALNIGITQNGSIGLTLNF
jgi:hypothetical protein